jgi:hypothetical protein
VALVGLAFLCMWPGGGSPCRSGRRALLLILCRLRGRDHGAWPCWGPRDAAPWPHSAVDYVHIGLSVLAFTAAYVITYSAVEADSLTCPSLCARTVYPSSHNLPGCPGLFATYRYYV